MLILGTVMGYIDKENPLKLQLYSIHKSTGVTILMLMLIRAIWRWINPIPALPDTLMSWQRKTARWSHSLLYALIIIMLLSGMVMSTATGHTIPFWGLFKFYMPWAPKNKTLASITSTTHLTLAWMIATLVVLHVAAAFKHHHIDKNDVLSRMLPGKTLS